MFTHKKFLAALFVAPLFVACGTSDDEGTSTNAETTAGETTNTTNSTSATTNSTSATTNSTSATSAETGSSGAESAGTSAAETAAETAGTTTGGGGGMFCTATCMEDADCCAPGAMDCPGDYPNNVTCTDGHCEFGECASDDDCAIFMNDAYACTAVSGFSGCFAICAARS